MIRESENRGKEKSFCFESMAEKNVIYNTLYWLSMQKS